MKLLIDKLLIFAKWFTIGIVVLMLIGIWYYNRVVEIEIQPMDSILIDGNTKVYIYLASDKKTPTNPWKGRANENFRIGIKLNEEEIAELPVDYSFYYYNLNNLNLKGNRLTISYLDTSELKEKNGKFKMDVMTKIISIDLKEKKVKLLSNKEEKRMTINNLDDMYNPFYQEARYKNKELEIYDVDLEDDIHIDVIEERDSIHPYFIIYSGETNEIINYRDFRQEILNKLQVDANEVNYIKLSIPSEYYFKNGVYHDVETSYENIERTLFANRYNLNGKVVYLLEVGYMKRKTENYLIYFDWASDKPLKDRITLK